MRRSLNTTRLATHQHAPMIPKTPTSSHRRNCHVVCKPKLRRRMTWSQQYRSRREGQPPPSKTVVDRTRPQSTPVPVRSGRAQRVRKAPMGHTSPNRVRPGPIWAHEVCRQATTRAAIAATPWHLHLANAAESTRSMAARSDLESDIFDSSPINNLSCFTHYTNI